jgi:prepilin-type processing-associated H-X9-DG protein
LTVTAVIGTLASLLLPAVSSAREAARLLQCSNHLCQIGIALHAYHDANQCLPAGWQWERSQQSAFGWTVPLLPYLEQRAVYAEVDRTQVLNHPSNSAARATSVAGLLCPSDLTSPTFTLFAEGCPSSPPLALTVLPTASYVGVFGTIEADDSIPAPLGDGTFRESLPVRFVQFHRGLSNTLVVGERPMAWVPSTWLGIDAAGEDAACRLVGSAMTTPNCEPCDECEFGSRHRGGATFLWGDGHVQLLSDNIDSREYRQLARRSEFK